MPDKLFQILFDFICRLTLVQPKSQEPVSLYDFTAFLLDDVHLVKLIMQIGGTQNTMEDIHFQPNKGAFLNG